MEPIRCLFCNEEIEGLYAAISARGGLDTIVSCPRCGAAVTFTTDLSDVRSLLAEVVFDTPRPTDEEMARMEVLIRPGVDTLLDTPGGEVIGEVHLAVAWDPREDLTTAQAARILGISREETSRLCQAGKLSGAYRAEPTRPRRYKRGRWRIPRRALWERMRRTKWR